MSKVSGASNTVGEVSEVAARAPDAQPIDLYTYSPSHLPYGIESLGVPAECKTCHGCERCDGSEYEPRMISRRWVCRSIAETTAGEYLVAEQELRVLSRQLDLPFPGIDAQTQTDGEEGDTPCEPWHCWSVFHQEGWKG